MITDIHTHILYDIDDGAKDIWESLELIEMEIANDVDIVVLTPHFDSNSDSLEIFEPLCREHYDTLLKRSLDKNIANTSNITLVLGSETFYSSALMYYNTLKPLCIGNTQYLLIEFSTEMVFDKDFFVEFEALIAKFDIVPIVAHIERCKHIQKHINIIRKLKKLECIIQVNANYILNNIDNRFVKRMVKHGYIDIIASDCHDIRRRPPNLKAAFSLIDEKYDGYYSKILAGKYKKINVKLRESQNKW